jgi:Fe2+ or Zn2+ uptake regulation protein
MPRPKPVDELAQMLPLLRAGAVVDDSDFTGSRGEMFEQTGKEAGQPRTLPIGWDYEQTPHAEETERIRKSISRQIAPAPAGSILVAAKCASQIAPPQSLIRIVLDKITRFTILPMPMKPRADRVNTNALPEETIHGHGLRMTDQRRAIYDTLMERRDHPTAVEVFTRVREHLPSISLATVYNCLETLSECGLVKTVNLERGPGRYCPNLEDHAHFHCEACSTVLDLPLRVRRKPEDVWELPEQLSITHHEVAFRGVCPKCMASRSVKKAGALNKPSASRTRASRD